jgi:hypothetical protein
MPSDRLSKLLSMLAPCLMLSVPACQGMGAAEAEVVEQEVRRPPADPLNPFGSAPQCVPPVARYTGDYPSDRNANWASQSQGVANDDQHWFFTQKSRVVKFHVSEDLRKNTTAATPAAPIPPHLRADYDHYGDLDQYGGYLFIPLEARGDGLLQRPPSDRTPRIVVLRASDLSYVADVRLPAQSKAGWVAINPKNSTLFTSHDSMSPGYPLYRYRIDWPALAAGSLRLAPLPSVTVLTENGAPLSLAGYIQGGDFSDDGCTLYMVNGKDTSGDPSHGIHVIDTATWTRHSRSAQGGEFAFEFHPRFLLGEEAEGLTYWVLPEDLSFVPPGKTPVPGQYRPAGSLHVMLANTADGSLFFKHYR